MGAWSVGAVLAAIAIWRRRSSGALNIVVLTLDLLALLAVGALLFAFSRTTRLF